jgi:protein gp37
MPIANYTTTVTAIEWVLNPDGSQGYTWNPITGCLNHVNGLCKGGGFPCYAYKLAHTRLKRRYIANHNILPAFGSEKAFTDPFYPRFWEERLSQPMTKITRWGRDRRVIHQQRPKGIFVCDMGDLFGIGIPESWTRQVLETIQDASQHRFYLLTKQPQNLIKFSPFPENCWVGVTNTGDNVPDLTYLARIEAKIKFISFEPLLRRNPFFMNLDRSLSIAGIDWLIIGGCTGSQEEMTKLARTNSSFLSEMPWGNKWTAQPNPDWVKGIVEAADKAGVKVFLKDNLRVLLPKEPPFYTKCCADVNGKDPCYEEPCLSEQLVDECSKAPNFWMLRQEMPNGTRM